MFCHIDYHSGHLHFDWRVLNLLQTSDVIITDEMGPCLNVCDVGTRLDSAFIVPVDCFLDRFSILELYIRAMLNYLKMNKLMLMA